MNVQYRYRVKQQTNKIMVNLDTSGEEIHNREVVSLNPTEMAIFHISLFKNATRPLFLLIFGLFKQTSLQFLQQINVKKCPVHPVYDAGIQIHNLSNMNHLP